MASNDNGDSTEKDAEEDIEKMSQTFSSTLSISDNTGVTASTEETQGLSHSHVHVPHTSTASDKKDNIEVSKTIDSDAVQNSSTGKGKEPSVETSQDPTEDKEDNTKQPVNDAAALSDAAFNGSEYSSDIFKSERENAEVTNSVSGVKNSDFDSLSESANRAGNESSLDSGNFAHSANSALSSSENKHNSLQIGTQKSSETGSQVAQTSQPDERCGYDHSASSACRVEEGTEMKAVESQILSYSYLDISLLLLFDFKSHCEQLFRDYEMAVDFDQQNGYIRVQAISCDWNEILICIKKFLEDVSNCHKQYKGIIAKLLTEKPSARQYVANELLQSEINYFWQHVNGVWFVYCKPENQKTCAQVIESSLHEWKILVTDQKMANKFLTDVIKNDLLHLTFIEYLKDTGRGNHIHVIGTSSIANTFTQRMKNFSLNFGIHNFSTSTQDSATHEHVHVSRSTDLQIHQSGKSPTDAKHHSGRQGTTSETHIHHSTQALLSAAPQDLTRSQQKSGVSGELHQNSALKHINPHQEQGSHHQQGIQHEPTSNENRNAGNTSRRSMIIPVEPLITNILKRNERLRMVIFYQLSRCDVYLDVNELNKGFITVVHPNPESCDKVQQFLSKAFLTEKIEKHMYLEHQDDIKSYCQKHNSWLEIKEYSDGLTIVYHACIAENLSSILWNLKCKPFLIPLPGYMVHYLPILTRDLKQHFSVKSQQVNVEFVIHEDCQGPSIKVTVDRTVDRLVLHKINNVLGKLVFRELQLDCARGQLFQQMLPQYMKDIEKDHLCTVNIHTPDQRILLHAWSPLGHQLMICHGNMASADADMFVLPLCDGQSKWPPSHEHILNSAYLPSSIGRFNTMIGSKQGDKKVLELCGNGTFAGKKVMLMAVPGDVKDSLSKDKFSQSLSAVLHSAAANAVVALPLKLTPDGNVSKHVKLIVFESVLLLARQELQNKNITLKLYADHKMMTEQGFPSEEVDKCLTNQKWSTSGFLKTNTSKQHVWVYVGEILQMKADVLVNSTDPNLIHKGGKVSRILLEKAGQGLTKECKQLYPEGLHEHIVAVTDSFEMKQFKQIFHIALSQKPWSETEGNNLLDTLKECIQTCLVLASARHFHSIVFPILGTGTWRYPAQKVSEAMFSVIRDFFKEMPCSSLQHVYICCYHKDKDLRKVFKAEETIHAYGLSPQNDRLTKNKFNGAWTMVLNPGAWSAMDSRERQSIIQFVKGEAKPLLANLLICANTQIKDDIFRQWNKCRQLPNWCVVSNPSKTKDQVKKALEKAEDSCTVQIILAEFGFGQFSDIIEGVAKGLKSHGLHVVFIASNEGEFRAILDPAAKKWKNIEYYFEDLSGTGKMAPDETSACIQVCGPKTQVEHVFGMINSWKIPEQSVQTKRQSALPGESSVDPDKDSVANDTEPQVKELEDYYTFSIPKKDLKTSDMDALLQDPQLRKWINVTALAVKFCPKMFEEFKAAVNIVAAVIGQHETKSQPDASQSESKAGLQSEETFTKELSLVAVEALKILMPADFSKLQTVKTTDGVKTSCHGPVAQDILNRIDSLRQEEVQLSDAELQQIKEPLDASAQGIAAVLMPVPQQGKVLIFSFDYGAISSAKHLLYVKIGRLKLTRRGQRKFAGQEGTSDTHISHSSLNSSHSGSSFPPETTEVVDFTTGSGIKVSVYKTDITKLPVDAIVNAANENLAHAGGVAYAIAKVAGFSLDDEGEEYIKKHGPLKVKEVVDTTGGSLPCKKVLHAVGPRWTDYKDKALCQQALAETIYNCLDKANSMQITSLAVPSISSAIFGVPQNVCAMSYLQGLQNFENVSGRSTCLKQIHFVDVNNKMIRQIQETFKQFWDADLPAAVISNNKDSNNKVPPADIQRSSDATTGNSSEPSSEDIQGSDDARTGNSSEPSSEGFQRSSDAGIGNSFRVVSSSQSPNHSIESLVQTGQTQALPIFRVLKSNNDVRNFEYQYCFQDLVLHLHRQKVSETVTEALLLWKGFPHHFVTSLARQFWKNEQSPELKTALANLLKVTGNLQTSLHCSRLIILSDLPGINCDRLQDFIEKCFSKMDLEKIKSLTILNHPLIFEGASELEKTLWEFAKGVYKAVKKYSNTTPRQVQDIHIIHPNCQIIRSLADVLGQVAEESLAENLPTDKQLATKQIRTEDHCTICFEAMTEPKSLNCGHAFCKVCIDQWLLLKARCPHCRKIQGILQGNQPADGKMSVCSRSFILSGYEGCGTLQIEYQFPRGTQSDDHPCPGLSYEDEKRTAYLPDTPEGRKILMLLKIAFDRRLIFTVGQSSTSSKMGIVWNGIHHKTQPKGSHGYPDPSYLRLVQEELKDVGVTEEALSLEQKDFIETPKKYLKGYWSLDLTKCFGQSGKLETPI